MTGEIGDEFGGPEGIKEIFWRILWITFFDWVGLEGVTVDFFRSVVNYVGSHELREEG